MAKRRIIKCISCGVYNENLEFCKNCGAVLSFRKRREQKVEAQKKKRAEVLKMQPPNFIENLRSHPNMVYRITGAFLYSSFAVVSAIGAFIAWLVFAIAAG
ncbi:hypothetical protein [uncultured Winogradskyella sp.]|uniref:hypothetical protein n=1 Tax=uncultured Winogradskyella sp. TaxID=395353 RepID=UPI00262ACCF3|nr:hypothetical protein [uncultured Winogradskyella sp.]